MESDGCLEDGCLLPADVFSDDADEDSDSEEEMDMEYADTGRCGQVGGVSSTSASTAIADRGGQKKVLKSMSVGVGALTYWRFHILSPFITSSDQCFRSQVSLRQAELQLAVVFNSRRTCLCTLINLPSLFASDFDAAVINWC